VFFSSIDAFVIIINAKYNILKSGDIWTTIYNNFGDNFFILSFNWSKTIEREKERERI